MFTQCTNPNILLADVVHSQGRLVKFRTSLVGIDFQEWTELLHLISSTSFTYSHDKIEWKWEVSGKFSTHSIYKILNFGGYQPKHAMIWWNLLVPPKIRVFMWLVSHNTILTKDNLAIKGWVGDPKCQFCLHHELIDHLFITCTLAQQIWFWLGKSQFIMQSWTTWDSILAFAYSLDVIDRTRFLILISAVS